MGIRLPYNKRPELIAFRKRNALCRVSLLLKSTKWTVLRIFRIGHFIKAHSPFAGIQTWLLSIPASPFGLRD